MDSSTFIRFLWVNKSINFAIATEPAQGNTTCILGSREAWGGHVRATGKWPIDDKHDDLPFLWYLYYIDLLFIHVFIYI